MSEYMSNKQLCPKCRGEGAHIVISEHTHEVSDFKPCVECNGEGYIFDEDATPLEPHYKELDEFDASKEQDIKDSLRDE
jgi:excinuclease UvrABC ATPase subunit